VFHNRTNRGETMNTLKQLSSLPFSIQATILAVLSFLFVAGNGLALDHSGTIAANETWLAADNPHVVVDNVTVNAGVTLTIQAGAEVYFNASRRLTTNGILTAVGAPGQEILFTKNTASDWNYLYFTGTGSGTFEYCTIEECSYGFYGNSSGAISASNVTIQNCNYGIYDVNANTWSISDCQFLDNNYGIYVTSGSIDLGSTSLTGNATYGFYGAGVAPNLLDGNVALTDNGTGFRVDNVASLNLLTPMNITGSTTTGIHLKNCDEPTVDNQVLTGNAGTNGAFLIEDCGEFTLGAGNTIGGSGLENSWPVSIGAGSYPSAGGVIPTTGNTSNDIQVAGGTSARTGTWRKFTDLDYIVTVNPTISAGGELILEPGLNLRFGPSRRLTISGTLTAVGAPGQEILFTKNTASDWNYPYFIGSGGGTLEHCLIEECSYGIYGAGSGAISVSNVQIQNTNYGIYSSSTNVLSVSDCQILDANYGLYISGGSIDLGSTSLTGNATYGFYGAGVAPNLLDGNVALTDNGTGFRVDNVASLNLLTPMNITGSTTTGIHLKNCDEPTVDNQVLTGNAGTNGAFLIEDCGEFTLGAGNTIGGSGLENSWPVSIGAGSYPSAGGVIPTTGNTSNDIQVAGGTSARTGTWRKFTDLDYIVTVNPTISAGGELILEPGLNLRFGPSRRLTISGTLTAVGAPGQEILFTKSTASDWNYLYFTGSGGGTLEHCTIEDCSYAIYGNSSGAISASFVTMQNCTYGVYAPSTNTLSLNDCLIENNGYGIRASGGTISLLRNRIINNTDYGIYLDGAEPTFGTSLSEWNDIYGNGTGQPGRDLRNGVTDIYAVYVHWGTLDHEQILTQIWDWHDDTNLGFVYVLPYVTASHQGEISAVDDPEPERDIPLAFGVFQNAPNPFNPSTVIRFDLTGTTPVTLKVFDVSGALVATLVDDHLPAGHHQAVWHGRDDQGRSVSSGAYIYRIAAGNKIETRQMMLVK